MESGPKNHNGDGLPGRNSIMVIYMDPLGYQEGTFDLCLSVLHFTYWRVGGVSKQLYYRVISTITPIRIPFRVPITLLTTYLVSPPTLQVG